MQISEIYNYAMSTIKKFINDNFESSCFNEEKISYLIAFLIILLISLLLIFHYSSFDLEIQKHFFSKENGWFVDKDNLLYKYIFYIIPKKIITVISIVIILLYFITRSTYFNENERKIINFLILSVAISLISVSMLKQISNMYCPDTLKNFGGNNEYTKLFEESKKLDLNSKPGKCYPAGHASGGFAFLSIFFILRKRKIKMVILFIIFAMGWIMGGYQILKGSHFLSDTLVTMMICIIISTLAYKKIFINKR